MARRYTDEDKAAVIASLKANEGNVKRTARETDIPEQTVRDWKKQAERGQLPEKVQEAVSEAQDALITKMEGVQNKALTAIEEGLDAGEVKPRDAITVFGVLTDKIRLLQGQATARVESLQPAADPVQIGQAVGAALEIAFSMARQRESEIVDAEYEEQAPEALPAPPS